MDVLKEVRLGDRVEIMYKESFETEASPAMGYVRSLSDYEIELSPEGPGTRAFKYESKPYRVKDIKSCTIWPRVNELILTDNKN